MSQVTTIEMMLETITSLATENGQLKQKLDDLTSKHVAYENVRSLEELSQKVRNLITTCMREPENRINQIKAVREITGHGLKDAKQMVESAWDIAGKPWERPER